jgi:hypothetical protein
MTADTRATLVMFSSGVDSTYTLLKLLTETGDDIYAHHINMVNMEARHHIERERSRAIIAWCNANIRKVKYSESTIDHRGLKWFGFDIMAVGFEAGVLAHSFQIARGKRLDRWTIGTCLEEGHDEKRFAHVLNCCAANCYPHTPPDFFLMPLVPKAEEMAWLPRPVLDLCWTCRRPVQRPDGSVEECGTCKTCQIMNGIRAGAPTPGFTTMAG